MADKHPYSPSSGGITNAITHLRRSFPAQINSETLKKLGIAPNNESYIINVLKFLKIIDAEGKKVPTSASVFSKHNDAEFQKEFSQLVHHSYADLFELHGEEAWTLPSDKLISYFRSSDQSTAIVGQRQSQTFQVLAGLSGKRDATASAPSSKTTGTPSGRTQAKMKTAAPRVRASAPSRQEEKSDGASSGKANRDIGLAVRIEINLPAGGDQDTYDRIFKSIRANLIDGN
jgi:hypothetical protein